MICCYPKPMLCDRVTGAVTGHCVPGSGAEAHMATLFQLSQYSYGVVIIIPTAKVRLFELEVINVGQCEVQTH